MSTYKDKKDSEKMYEYAVSTAVDSRIISQGAEQLDKAAYNINKIDEYLNDEISLKKELLSLLRESKKTGLTPELRAKIEGIQIAIKRLSAPEMVEQQQIKTQEIGMSYQDMVKSNKEFAEELGIDLSNPYLEALSNIDASLLSHELAEKFDLLRLDKYDYAFAAAVGLLCGAVDAILVGTASTEKEEMGKLAQKTDEFYDGLVKRYAKKCGWEGPKVNADGTQSDSLKSAIAYLEREFPVNYDHRTTADVSGMVKGITPKNHHMLSMSHSPLGLVFAIFDLLDNKATFFDPGAGKLVRVAGEWSKGAAGSGKANISGVPEAITRWFGHLMSDIAGSSGSAGRGAGIPTGFQTVLQSFDFGKIPLGDNVYGTIGEAVTKMYENGFDFRFQTATAIPVIINEVLIRLYWFLKQHFYYGKSIKESLPVGNNRELQRMLLIATLAFSSVDVTHAIVKGYVEQNPITLLNSLNYIGLADFGYKLLVNFKLEHAHNKQVKNLMQDEIRKKHEELMQADYLLK